MHETEYEVDTPKRLTFSIWLGLTAILVLPFSTGHSQKKYSPDFTQERYERKSISYLDLVVLNKREVSFEAGQENYLLSRIRSTVEVPRFDYNPLPSGVTRQLDQRLTRLKADESDLPAILEGTLARPLTDILDLAKEIRAKDLVTEAQRNSFLASKAKTYGITSTELENVMNSAYVYIPFVTKTEQSRKHGAISYQIVGGLLWYRLVQSEPRSRFELIRRIDFDEVWSTSESKDYEVYRGKRVNPRDYIFLMAYDKVMEKLGLETKEVEDFNLRTPIAEVDGQSVSFVHGTKEGIQLDDEYYVYEYQESGRSAVPQLVGLVRVNRVNDNARGEELSSARIVFGDNIGSGMSLREYPQKGTIGFFGFGSIPMVISKGILQTKVGTLQFLDQTKRISCFSLDFQFNLAQKTKITQFFWTLGMQFGNAPISYSLVKNATVSEFSNIFCFGLNVGLLKKLYFRRLSLGLEISGGGGLITGSDDAPSGDTFDISRGYFGAAFRAGIEYRLSAGYLLSFRGEYWLSDNSGSWRIDKEDADGVPLTTKGITYTVGIGVVM